MPTPTFVGEHEQTSGWNTKTPQTKTSPSFPAVAGDVLVALAGASEPDTTFSTSAVTNSGTALTWTRQEYHNGNGYNTTAIFTAIVDTNRSSMTVSCTASNTVSYWGFTVLHFRDSSGIGANEINYSTTDTPATSITTVLANSSLCVINTDWYGQLNATHTYRSVNGSTGTVYTHGGYVNWICADVWLHTDAGATGTKTVGQTAPTGQYWVCAVVEVKGTAAQGFSRSDTCGLTDSVNVRYGKGKVFSDSMGMDSEWSGNPDIHQEYAPTLSPQPGPHTVAMTDSYRVWKPTTFHWHITRR